MKRTVALVLTLLLIAALGVFASSADTVELLPKESEWEFLTYEGEADALPAEEEPELWLSNGEYTDLSGQAPFAAPSWAKPITNTKFDYQYYAAYLRTTFTVENVELLNKLTMFVIYDENPTVYINGEEVWYAEGYKDDKYYEIDLTDALSVLKDGENTVCVSVSNVFGGGIFDMSLSANAGAIVPEPPIDEDGNFVIQEVTTAGFANFGAINSPDNVLDGDQNTVTGSGFNDSVEQSVTLKFKEAGYIDSVFVQCKDEGTTTNEDGTRGTYHLYALNGDEQVDLGTLKAVTGTDGGATLTLSAPVAADGLKIVIESWEGDCWACVADVTVKASDVTPPPVVDTGDNTLFYVVLGVVALAGTALITVKAKKEF